MVADSPPRGICEVIRTFAVTPISLRRIAPTIPRGYGA
jgi:hypothetical protein